MQPKEALYGLAYQLRQRGLERIYAASDSRIGVLSVAADLDTGREHAPGMTVWTDGNNLCVRGTRMPATDPIDAARVVMRTIWEMGGMKEGNDQAEEGAYLHAR